MSFTERFPSQGAPFHHDAWSTLVHTTFVFKLLTPGVNCLTLQWVTSTASTKLTLIFVIKIDCELDNTKCLLLRRSFWCGLLKTFRLHRVVHKPAPSYACRLFLKIWKCLLLCELPCTSYQQRSKQQGTATPECLHRQAPMICQIQQKANGTFLSC